jgi:secretion/DNA translocation related TadE-like protein
MSLGDIAGRARADDGERGSATLIGAGSVLALLAMLAVCLQLGVAVITRHRAEAAADLAALAVASHAVLGTDAACADGRRVTDRMAVGLVACQLQGWEATVEVEATTGGLLATFGGARAAARAGPAEASGAAADGPSRRAVGQQR